MCAAPWEGSGEETVDGPTGALRMSAEICYDLDEADICGGSITFDVVELPGEEYSLVLNQTQVSTLCRLTGRLDMEDQSSSHSRIHIIHL